MTSVSKKYEFILDLDKGYLSDSLTLIQASSNVRRFEVQLTKEELPFDLSNCLVKAVYMKPDDMVVLNDVEIKDVLEGHISVGLTEQCMAEEGRVRCEIVVINVMEESFIAFPTFSFKVKESLFMGSSVESTNEFQTLLNAISKVESFDDIASEIVANVEQSLIEAQQVLANIQTVLEDSSDKLLLIKNNHAESETALQGVLDDCSVIEEISENMKKLGTDIQKIHQLAQQDTGKIQEYKSLIEQLHLQASKHTQLISENYQTSQAISEDMQTIKKESNKIIKEIDSNATRSETLVKTISEKATNSNNWSVSINNVLINSNSRYDEILKVKTNALNTLSDINYYGVLAELEVNKIKEIAQQGEQKLLNMQTQFDAKMKEFEDRFNELVGDRNV